MLVDTLQGATVIPNAAVQRGNQGTFVYVVQPDMSVTVRAVKLGPVQGEIVAVESGVQPGDIVVTDGADRLREGAKVEIADRTQRPERGGKGEGKGKGRRGEAGGKAEGVAKGDAVTGKADGAAKGDGAAKAEGAPKSEEQGAGSKRGESVEKGEGGGRKRGEGGGRRKGGEGAAPATQ